MNKTTNSPWSTTGGSLRDDPEAVREQVRQGYGEIARTADAEAGCCGPAGGCCGPPTLDAATLASQVGYTEEELRSLPEGSNLGLSCGNPTAIAALQPGEVLLDLGSGAGFDVFLAGPRVGAGGRAIGVDMTPDMVSRARRSLPVYRERTKLDNVEFRLGEIEHLPVDSASVDVVISNCVINLSPTKPQVWKEIFRVLRPGGRVAVSDLALLRPLPEAVQEVVEAWVGCVAGAVLAADTRRMLEEAGFTDISLTPQPQYVAAQESFQDPLYARIAAALPEGTRASDYLTSLTIEARKPR